VIGTLINRFAILYAAARDGESFVLSQTEFNREIIRERMRATRRAIPFCVVTLELVGRRRVMQRRRMLLRMLHRNVRLTDQKGNLGQNRVGLLLVDTPEIGGRAVLDRISILCDAAGLKVTFSLQVHDAEEFSCDDSQFWPTGGERRRRSDRTQSAWTRSDESMASDSRLLSVTLREAPTQLGSERPATVSIGAPGGIALQSFQAKSNGGIGRIYHVVKGPPIRPRSQRERWFKRCVDVAGASVGLLITSPIMMVGAIAIKLTSPGPVFFRQTREGMAGRPFTIYKMRTMVVDAEGRQTELRGHSHRDGPAFKIKNDPRATVVGRFLRRTCIDELPQLINVLRGEMSLVGPRPLPWHESRACNHWHRRRLDVPPGMTCHWQINKAAAKSFDDWMRMDLRYVDRRTFWQDVKLIARTVVVPFTGRGSE